MERLRMLVKKIWACFKLYFTTKKIPHENETDLITSCCSGKEPGLVDWTQGTGRN